MFSIFPKTFVFGATSLEPAVCSFIQCNINPLSDLMSVHSRIFSILKVLKHFYRWFSQQNTNTKNTKRQRSFFTMFPDFGILIKFWLKVWSWSNDQALTEFQSLLPLRSVGSSTSIWVANMGKHKVWKLLTIRGQIKKIWIWRMYLQLIHRV